MNLLSVGLFLKFTLKIACFLRAEMLFVPLREILEDVLDAIEDADEARYEVDA